MTPLREVVMLCAGHHTIIVPVKDEINDIEQHVDSVLRETLTNPSGRIIQIGQYKLRGDVIIGYYFRNYQPDLTTHMQKATIKYIEQETNEDHQ